MADAVDRMRPKELWGDPAAAALALDAATRHPPAAFPATLDVAACLALLQRCERLLRAEPTVLEVRWPGLRRNVGRQNVVPPQHPGVPFISAEVLRPPFLPCPCRSTQGVPRWWSWATSTDSSTTC